MIYLNVELVLQMKKLIYIVQQLINILWNNSITNIHFRGICRDTLFNDFGPVWPEVRGQDSLIIRNIYVLRRTW